MISWLLILFLAIYWHLYLFFFDSFLTKFPENVFILYPLILGSLLLLAIGIQHIFLDEVHILNLAIDVKFQSQGLGKILMKRFLKNFTNPTKIILEVKESNYIAINLYKKLEFYLVDTRKNYYKNSGRFNDSYTMHLTL